MPVLSLKQKILLSNMCIVLFLFAIVGFIIVPSINYIVKLKKDINSIQLQIENRYQQAKKLKRSLTELGNLKQNASQFKQSFLKPGSELILITELEQIASRHQIEQNLNINLIDENTKNQNYPVKEKNILPVYYQLSFLNNGFMPDQMNFLRDMEKLPYYIIVNNLTIEKRKTSAENEKNPVTMRFDAIVYVENQ